MEEKNTYYPPLLRGELSRCKSLPDLKTPNQSLIGRKSHAAFQGRAMCHLSRKRGLALLAGPCGRSQSPISRNKKEKPTGFAGNSPKGDACRLYSRHKKKGKISQTGDSTSFRRGKRHRLKRVPLSFLAGTRSYRMGERRLHL